MTTDIYSKELPCPCGQGTFISEVHEYEHDIWSSMDETSYKAFMNCPSCKEKYDLHYTSGYDYETYSKCICYPYWELKPEYKDSGLPEYKTAR